jgi:hypothetical protein
MKVKMIIEYKHHATEYTTTIVHQPSLSHTARQRFHRQVSCALRAVHTTQGHRDDWLGNAW